MKIIIAGVPNKISSGVRTHVLSLKQGLIDNKMKSETISSYPNFFEKIFISIPYKILNKINKNLAYKWKFIGLNKIIYPMRIDNVYKKSCESNEQIVINIQSVDWYYAVSKYLSNEKVSIVLTVHGAYADQLQAKGYSEAIVKKVLDLEKVAFKAINTVITVSTKNALYISEISGREDSIVIPNGISVGDESSEVRMFQPKENHVQCVFLGSLIEYKGVDIAIKAIDILKNNEKKVCLDIIGEGPDEKKLKRMVEELGLESRVRFLGLLPQNEVRKKLLDYEISLVPSIPYGDKGEESFSYACIESMYSGLVTIASDLGGLSKIIDNNKNGFLVPHSNPKEIVKLIEKYSRRPYDYIKIREEAINTITINYSASAMAKKYVAAYLRNI